MTYTSITLMVPTYKRVDKLSRFIDSALKHALDPKQVNFAFCVNHKDSDTYNFLLRRYFPFPFNVNVVKESTRQPHLAKFWNMLFDAHSDEQSLVSMVADDMEFATIGWDSMILDEFNRNEGKLILYCDDDYIAHDRLCVNLFTTPQLVKASGFPFMCTHFAADMVDVVWMSVGKLTGLLKYRGDIVIRHNHMSKEPDQNKWDETEMRLNPLKKMYSNKEAQKKAEVYAHRVAMKLIENGYGQWNLL